MAFWNDFVDTAGKTVGFLFRGATHVGGGAVKGGLTGAKWGIIAAALIGIAATVALSFVIPGIAAGIGALFFSSAGAATFAGAFSMSTMGALGAGALISIPTALVTLAPHPVLKGIGFGLAALAAPALFAIAGAAGGLTVLAGCLGATAFAGTAIATTKSGAIFGGALGALGRIFTFGAKETERAATIEQHKTLDAQQETAQVSAYEAQAAEKLREVEEKAKRYQVGNALAKENGGTNILNRQSQKNGTQVAMGGV